MRQIHNRVESEHEGGAGVSVVRCSFDHSPFIPPTERNTLSSIGGVLGTEHTPQADVALLLIYSVVN